jgi:hypothetical protein
MHASECRAWEGVIQLILDLIDGSERLPVAAPDDTTERHKRL